MHLNLNPSQQQVFDHGLLNSGFSCVLQMPTSSGKTWLAEQAIRETLEHGYRAIYLSPLRALAAELYERWSMQFADHRVAVFTGDSNYNRSRPPIPFLDARLLIMTPERLDACTRNWRTHWAWIAEVDLIVVDELHLLGQPLRGPRLEGTLLRLRRLNPFLRIIGLSATLGNREDLADWLGGVEFHSDWRAIPLEWRTRRYRKAEEKPLLLLEEVGSCISEGGKCLVFVQSRRRAENLAVLLREQGIAAGHHHAGLTAATRKDVETKFREKQLDVLFSTGTLEMGLNLPVRQVILYDLQAFDGIEFSPLPVNTVWQRAGRAGRPGLDTKGEAVLFAPTWDKQVEAYQNGRFDPILSGLSSPHALAEQVLAEVGSGLCRREEQLTRAFNSSLAERQGRLPSLRNALSTMLESGMLTEVAADDSRKAPLLKATRLGRIAVRQMLLPEAVLHLHRNLTKEDNHQLTFLDLLLIAIGAPGFEPLLPCDFEDLSELDERLLTEHSLLLQGPNNVVAERFRKGGRHLIGTIRTSLIARSWTRLGNIERVAEHWNCYPFEIHRLSENLDRMMSAMVAMLATPKNDENPSESQMNPLPDDFVSVSERVRILLAMVQHGLDETTATLTYVPGIGPTLARRLVEAGIGDIEDLAQAEPKCLANIRGVSLDRASRWIEAASDLLTIYPPHRLKEFGPTVRGERETWPDGVDPYRLGRAIELSVKLTGKHRFLVTGGLDPHQVQLDPDGDNCKCDCRDFAAGHVCKHILAVRLKNGDSSLHSITKRICQPSPTDSLDLHSLWLESKR